MQQQTARHVRGTVGVDGRRNGLDQCCVMMSSAFVIDIVLFIPFVIINDIFRQPRLTVLHDGDCLDHVHKGLVDRLVPGVRADGCDSWRNGRAMVNAIMIIVNTSSVRIGRSQIGMQRSRASLE